MKKFFTFLLYLLIIILISAVVVGITMLLGRPLQEAAIAVAVILSIWLLVVLIRKMIIRHRAKAQVERIIQKENAIIDAELGKSPKELLNELKHGWKHAVKLLKKSHLKLKGDPLYVLPWYMVFGKPRSGKSTALKNAQLITPAFELSEHEDGSTLNLEWWLYDQAIVIDTAGRYAVPDVDKRDRKEWSTLLSMLSRHKQKEPLNGLVLVVAADRLLNNSEEALMEEGHQVRSGINELMEKLEIQMPVYLMITKCDLVDQFSNWCEYLPAESLKQVMGYLNTDDVSDIDSILDKGFDTVIDRIKQLRLLMMERSDNPDDSLIELPVNLEKMRAGLHAFASTALKDNLYQETPKFRGLYFSSSQQQISGQAGETKLVNHGMFLHHLFTHVMPPDRGLLGTLPSAERLRRAFRNYSLSVSGFVTAAIIVGLSVAFVNDKSTLEDLLDSNTEINLSQNNINQQINAMNRLNELLLDIEKIENEWMLPWYGPYQHSPHYNRLLAEFVNGFNEQILASVDSPLNNLVSNIEGEKTAYLVSGLVRRINLLNNKINASTLDESLANIPDEYLTVIGDSIDAESAQMFSALYRRYIQLQTANVVLAEEKLRLQAALENAIYSNHSGYDWLISWANEQGLPEININDFWGGSGLLDKVYKVDAAYTQAGKQFIDTFLNELNTAAVGSNRIASIKSDFMAYYQRRYLKAWQSFVDNFDQGKKKLKGRKEWLTALEGMTGRDNPYFNLMQKIHEETQGVDSEGLFTSREKISYFTEIQAFSGDGAGKKGKNKLAKTGLKLLGKFGKVGKLAAKAGKKGLKAKKKADKGKGVDLNAVLEEAAKAYGEYKKSLLEVSFNVDSRHFSYNSMSAVFKNPEDPTAGDGSGASAWKAIRQLQMVIGKPQQSSHQFWNLYSGPIRLAYDYMQNEAACFLQGEWQDNVLAEIVGVDEDKLGQTLIGENGLVWNFVDGAAEPFLKKKYRKGYIPAKANGKTLSWEKEFISYVNASDKGREYVGNEFVVKISALPTGINQGASVSPYATYLDLHCADKVQNLSNYNYSASKEFNWSLKQCGDVVLRIELGELTLRKQYTGRKGFSKFLAEFRDGRRVFTAEEFPEQLSQLQNESVTAIDVNYNITGQQPVIQILNTISFSPPKTALSCWSQQ